LRREQALAAAVVGAVAWEHALEVNGIADRRLGEPRRRRASRSVPARRSGFVEFLKVAFPLMLISIVISHAYLYLRYL
jgi:hypothetical protein